MTCGRLWEADAVADGRFSPIDIASFEAHTRACAECRSSVALDRRLRVMLCELPDTAPGELGFRRLRARILRDMGAPRRRWFQSRARRFGVLVAALATLAMAIFVLTPRKREMPIDAEPGLAGTITPTPGATWLQARTAGVEKVSLLDGTVAIHVRKQTSNERFLVEMPDGEIEVRGTTFEVTVQSGATKDVHVVEGLVILRLRVGTNAELGPGQSWTVPIAPLAGSVGGHPQTPRQTGDVLAKSVLEPSPPPSQVRRAAQQPAHAVRQPTAPADEGTADYLAAMALYRDGRFAEAATAFDRFANVHPHSGTIDDALFLQATALARAGRAEAAAVVAERHIDRFPGSFHRRDAAILVARAARDRGDCEAAHRALARWRNDPDGVAVRALGECAR